MDRVERLAFNALPAALTADMWTHVYVQQPNSVYAGVTPATNEACGAIAPSEVCDRNFFGVSHFPCCITNFPQVTPLHSLAVSLWRYLSALLRSCQLLQRVSWCCGAVVSRAAAPTFQLRTSHRFPCHCLSLSLSLSRCHLT